MKQALQPFRVATVSSMGRSATLAAAINGGVLPRASSAQAVPGVGAWTTISAM